MRVFYKGKDDVIKYLDTKDTVVFLSFTKDEIKFMKEAAQEECDSIVFRTPDSAIFDDKKIEDFVDEVKTLSYRLDTEF